MTLIFFTHCKLNLQKFKVKVKFINTIKSGVSQNREKKKYRKVKMQKRKCRNKKYRKEKIQKKKYRNRKTQKISLCYAQLIIFVKPLIADFDCCRK